MSQALNYHPGATRNTSRRPYAAENVGRGRYGELPDYVNQVKHRNHFNSRTLWQDRLGDFEKKLPHQS